MIKPRLPVFDFPSRAFRHLTFTPLSGKVVAIGTKRRRDLVFEVTGAARLEAVWAPNLPTVQSFS